jgi:hypothetical protein
MTTMRKMTCDFYTQEKWNDAAVQMANLVQEHVFDRHFGVCPWLVEGYYVFYGNEGPSHVAALMTTVRQEIEMIYGMREVGAGVSTQENGYSWAIIVSAYEMFPNSTDDAIEQMEQAIGRAWMIARGFVSDAEGRG